MSNAEILLQVLLAAIAHAGEISALLSKAKAEDRDVTEAELDGLASTDDAARAALDEAIRKARGG